MSARRVRLAVTMGDPAGIGPEVTVKALAAIGVERRPIVVGDAPTMERAVTAVGSRARINQIAKPAEAAGGEAVVNVIQVAGILPRPIPFGRLDREAGRAAFESLSAGIHLALAGEIDVVVTAPLNKEALNLAGFHYAGHTEILKDLTGAADVAMLLWSETLRVVHVTTHVSLRQALDRITPERIVRVATLGNEAARRLGIGRPRIAVAGLNPHAGEHGLFGNEDEQIIAPAVETLRVQGIEASGPHAPDTVFARAHHGAFDLVVAMYHDQGHIPMKLVAFDSAVNATLGLPIVRTSPDHGTAFDIAGTGRANPRSMIEAIRLAASLFAARNVAPAKADVAR